jgi:3-deoxy-D-manno-octulosonic-acid transferase
MLFLGLNRNQLNLFLYNIFLLSYKAALHLAALWNPKAQLWVEGRKDWKKRLKSWQSASANQASFPLNALVNEEKPASLNTAFINPKSNISNPSSKNIWMHCASLGEFEQGRPLLEAVRQLYPDYKIVLTFFSPSGYEIRKNYSGADLVMYLPMDGPSNAQAFIHLIQPSLVLWVKYEYWYYFLNELKNKKIPVLLISGIFRKSQPFFKWYGQFWKTILESFEHLFVQTQHSQELLNSIHIQTNITVNGDTRFDRVTAIAEQWESLGEPIENFCKGHPILVAGSTWEEDDEVLIHYSRAYPKIRFIIAPHEVSKERIHDLRKEFPQATLYSALTKRGECTDASSNVLIIDNMGLLSRLYKYATITYVGGGFNQSGIHNILEAAVYGKPVIFGPVYEKFAEARDLVDEGGAYSIENAIELEALLNKLFNDPIALENCSQISRELVYSRKGATAKIMEHIQRNLLLIS